MITNVFQVHNMHCSACVMRLEGLEDDLPGVARVTASYRKQQMKVVYDAAQVTAVQIIAAARDLGYEAQLV